MTPEHAATGLFGLRPPARPRPRRLPCLLNCAVAAVAVMLACSVATAETFPDRARAVAKDELKILQAGQKDREAWSAEKKALAEKLAALEKKRDVLLEVQQQTKERIDAARARVTAKETTLDRIGEISARLRPFLDDIAARLEALLAEKPPFLMEERTARLLKLRETLMDPQVPVSEKYRKAFEALFVEAEYGRTIESTTETVDLDGETVLVEVFRLGRLSLFCRTLNKEKAGVYDVRRGRFTVLPDDAGRDVGRALDIGARRRPVELLTLPVGRIVPQ